MDSFCDGHIFLEFPHSADDPDDPAWFSSEFFGSTHSWILGNQLLNHPGMLMNLAANQFLEQLVPVFESVFFPCRQQDLFCQASSRAD